MNKFNTRDDVKKIVPHSGKMCLLDRVVSYSLQELSIETQVDIHPECMFFDSDMDGVPAWVGFEYMAQSISALSGIYGLSQSKPPKLGFIMSINSYKAEFPLFANGATLTMQVQQTMRMDAAVTFDGKIFIGNRLYATATLNTVEVDDIQKTLG